MSDYNIVNDRLCTNGDDGPVISLTAWKALGFDAHSLVANDLNTIFENQSQNNYHLKSGSQAINAGSDFVNNIVSRDIEGNSRPSEAKYDIGAYEFGAVLLVKDINQPIIKIYPNPASEYFYILDDSRNNVNYSKITIETIEGKLVKSNFTGQKLSLDNISSGLFIIKIYLKDGSIIPKKLVINKK